MPAAGRIAKELSDAGILVHIWQRKEIESYLIDARVIARISGTTQRWVQSVIDAAAADLKTELLGDLVGPLQQEAAPAHKQKALKEGVKEIGALLADPATVVCRCPAKNLLARVNQALQDDGKKTFSTERLAAGFAPNEIPAEVVGVISQAEVLGLA
jgi:hypothetical protein